MATVRKVLSVAGHLLLVVAAVVAVLAATSDLAYPALRHALVALVAALCVVSVLDAWMPYAGPGPLTPQGQLDQNRAEAIDPYGVLLLLGLIAAVLVVGAAVAAQRGRVRVTAAPVAVAEVQPD